MRKTGNDISLCMIVKNEQAHLSRCLESVRPVTAEMVIVDTGSTDLTRQIAADSGARVFDFVWRNDYAAARNFSLAKARCDWIFVLDADEVVAESDHARLRRLVARSFGHRPAFSFVTRNYTLDAHQVGWQPNRGRYAREEAGSGWIPTEKVRLFSNDPRITFSYPVHEVVEPSLQRYAVPIRSCSVAIHHYGPLDQNKTKSKNQTYFELGLEKLARQKHNPAALQELAVQAGKLGHHDDAIALWKRLLATRPNLPEAYVHLSMAYLKKAEYTKGHRTARAALKLDTNSKEAVYSFALFELLVGDPTVTAQQIRKLLQKYPEYLPARFLEATAVCCHSGSEAGGKRLYELKRTVMGPKLAATVLDLIGRLDSIGRQWMARRLLEAAIKAGLTSSDEAIFALPAN